MQSPDVEVCLQLELCEAFTWALKGAVNLWFLRLMTLIKQSSAAEEIRLLTVPT